LVEGTEKGFTFDHMDDTEAATSDFVSGFCDLRTTNPSSARVEARSAGPATGIDKGRRQLRLLAVCTAVLVLCFAQPLLGLVRLAVHNDLYSHVLLIPLVSAYLVWVSGKEKRESRKQKVAGADTKVGEAAEGTFADGRGATRHVTASSSVSTSSRIPATLAVLPLAGGVISIVGYFVAVHLGLTMTPVDSLAWTIFSLFLFFVAACCFCLERQTLRAAAFPIGFLIFCVPFPVVVQDAIEAFLQHTSADAAALLFWLVGTPFLRRDLAFDLPGFGLQVAPECSGIRSTLVLFVSSLVAGQLFLRSGWRRALFALAVIPLGVLRNGFRIVVLGELCVHVDPAFIDSPLHHRGGPIFFVISMVPFLMLLWWLRKTQGGRHTGIE
jgi:exosortase C (VPDSG-CTERM-specific)